MPDRHISTSTAFRRLILLLNAGWTPSLPSATDGIMLTKQTGSGRSMSALVFNNGTTVMDAPDGGEIRIRSYDEDDELLAFLK